MTIRFRDKIGLGTWDEDNRGSALNHVDGAGFGWHYTWSDRSLWDSDATPERSRWVAMLWDETDVTPQALLRIKASGAATLLGFNEPNHPGQANMTVDQALGLWSKVQNLGLRLGSPAATQGGTLGEGSWLDRFVDGAEARGLRVDFIAVHYYSEDGDVGKFKAFLEAVHKKYDRPIWVTEWALADWDRPGRFSASEQAAYAWAGAKMMDGLPFVERHAWYSGYDGDEGLNAEVFRLDGSLTPVGRAFQSMLDARPDLLGTSGSDVIVGGSAGEEVVGFAGSDRVSSSGGNDIVRAGGGVDTVQGGAGSDHLYGDDHGDRLRGDGGNDSLSGGSGADRLDGGSGSDVLRGGTGSDVFVFNQDRDRIADFRNDVDTIHLDDALWGGAARTLSQVLRMGQMWGTDAVFDFGDGDVLRISGVGSLEALRNDLVIV
jgi:Ca2+-binding RTX toxin-like protein